MLLFLSLLPLYFASILAQPDSLMLAQDMEKDLRLLHSSQYFISDNASLSPSLQTIEDDLQTFKVVANTSLSNASYSSSRQGNHEISRWDFAEGEIKSILQIETAVQLDTILMQRYLDNRPPTQQKVNNSFRFRTYAISTVSDPQKLLYITEADQGLLTYKLDNREVEIIYSKQKDGLSAVLPEYVTQVKQLVPNLQAKP